MRGPSATRTTSSARPLPSLAESFEVAERGSCAAAGAAIRPASTRSMTTARRAQPVELVGRRGDLVAVARLGVPRQPQRVAVVARDHVHVEVEDGLPCRAAARVERLTPSAPSALAHRAAQPLRGDARPPRRSSPGDLVQVAACSRGITSAWPRVAGLMSMKATVRSSSSTLVRGHLAGDDLAEQAVGVARPSARQPRLRYASLGGPCRADDRATPVARRRRDTSRDRAALGVRRASARRRSGSRRAARRSGCAARVEEERAHGTYWWPLGLLAAAGGARRRSRARPARSAPARRARGGGHRRRRLRRAALWFRRLLPHRTTCNVVAEAGDRDAERDARVRRPPRRRARRPDLPPGARRRWSPTRFPGWYERSDDLAAADAPGRRRAGARRARRAAGPRALRRAGAAGRRSARPRRSRDIAHARRSSRAPTTTSPRSRSLLELARLLRRAPGRGRARAARLHRLGGVVHGGHARLRAPPLRRAPTASARASSARDARLARADPARGRGDAPDARLHRRGSSELLAAAAQRRRRARCARGLRLALRDRRADRRCARGYRTATLGSVTSTRCRPTTTGRRDTADNVDYGTVARREALCEARRAAPQRAAGSSARARADRVLARCAISPAKLGLLELGEQLAELRPGRDPELARELVAAHERRAAGPASRQRERLAEHLARELEVARRSPRRRCARAWRGGRRR